MRLKKLSSRIYIFIISCFIVLLLYTLPAFAASKKSVTASCQKVDQTSTAASASTTTALAVPSYSSRTPVGRNGRLKVKGTKLVNSEGKTVTLKGVSTHGINWFSQYVNKKTFKTMRDNFGVSCIRLAMYTDDYNGYCSGGNQKALKKLVKKGVQYATELGMYVIIDWHILSDGNPKAHQSEALRFFAEMAKTYKKYPNVIYEICNEPNGTSWSVIKSYEKKIIARIRRYDKKNLILCGTPTWSQDVDTVADSPITGYRNLLYTCHFYADTHRQSYRDKVSYALNKGLPVFVSEFGTCDCSGNGSVNKKEANRWISFLKKNHISYVCWSLSNKDETCSIIKSSCSKLSGFTKSNLTTQGRWFKGI